MSVFIVHTIQVVKKIIMHCCSKTALLCTTLYKGTPPLKVGVYTRSKTMETTNNIFFVPRPSTKHYIS